jgi:hypothetical protein
MGRGSLSRRRRRFVLLPASIPVPLLSLLTPSGARLRSAEGAVQRPRCRHRPLCRGGARVALPTHHRLCTSGLAEDTGTCSLSAFNCCLGSRSFLQTPRLLYYTESADLAFSLTPPAPVCPSSSATPPPNPPTLATLSPSPAPSPLPELANKPKSSPHDQYVNMALLYSCTCSSGSRGRNVSIAPLLTRAGLRLRCLRRSSRALPRRWRWTKRWKVKRSSTSRSRSSAR